MTWNRIENGPKSQTFVANTENGHFKLTHRVHNTWDMMFYHVNGHDTYMFLSDSFKNHILISRQFYQDVITCI